MVQKEKLRYEMLLRVRDFGSQHHSLFPETSVAGKAFQTVADMVAAIEEQSANRLVTAQAGKKAKALARQDVSRRLTAIARCVRRAGRLEPKVAEVMRVPEKTSDLALITTARAFIKHGGSLSHQWVPLGLPETSIADLQQAVVAFERAIDDRRQGRTGQGASRTGLREALKRGFDAVSDLDVIVSNLPDLDPVVLAVWRESRRVNPKSSAGVADDVTDVTAGEVTTPAAPAAVTTEGKAASPPAPEGSSSTSLVVVDGGLQKAS